MKSKKHPDKALKQKIQHGPIFSIMPDRRGIINVTKLTRNALREVSNLKRKRDKHVKVLEKACLRVLADFNPLNAIELTEQLAVRSVAHKLCQDRFKYLAKGKLIPGWSGSLEYQFRVVTALLLLLEPFYYDDVRTRQPAKARHNKLQRR